MKKFILLKTLALSFFLLVAVTGWSQDIIVKNDKTEIKSKVTELTDAVIKYKKFEAPDGPVYNINKSDVFMIIYQNGTKEYITAPPQPNPPAPAAAPAPQVTRSTMVVDEEKMSDDAVSFATNSSGNSVDLEYAIFNTKPSASKLGYGGDLYSSLQTSPYYSYGAYLFLQYKYSFGKTHAFSLWANAGLNGSTITGYTDDNGDYIPSATSYSFLWEVGANYFFSKHFGVTAYTSEGNSEWFGLVIR